MDAINITIVVEPRDIPALVCSRRAEVTPDSRYILAVAEAVAQVVDAREFLFRPDRIHDLTRLIWERQPCI